VILHLGTGVPKHRKIPFDPTTVGAGERRIKRG
jgi:hypothetical protein